MDYHHKKNDGRHNLKERIALIDDYLDTHYHVPTKRYSHIDPSKLDIDASYSHRRLDDVLEDIDESFTERLFRYIREKGRTEPDVYKTANLTRQHFSKIRNDPDYSPRKNTVLSLALALKLNVDETKDLLRAAGFALSFSNKTDVIVRYHLENSMYDLYEINQILFHYGERPLTTP